MKPFAVAGAATLLKKVPEALVVPIVIKGSWELNRYGTFPLSFGEEITFTVLEPIETLTESAEEIIKKAENRIKKEFKN
jgi:1-acyl-sn-glycerol-3-phosphate acyltransferase